MQLIFHGLLKDLYGPSFEIEARNVFEAVEGFASQIPPVEGLIVEAIGYTTSEEMENSGPVSEVHLAPAMYGGGGKFGSFLIAALEVAVSFIPGVGQALAVGLRVAAIATAIGGIVNLIMPAPSTSKAADPPASKYLGLNQNTTALGTPWSLCWGQVRLNGQWLSLLSQANTLVQGNFPTSPA